MYAPEYTQEDVWKDPLEDPDWQRYKNPSRFAAAQQDNTPEVAAAPEVTPAPQEDKYAQLYEKFARKGPEAPSYRNERAERLGAALGNIFKFAADSAGMHFGGHMYTVAPYQQSDRFKDAARSEEAKRLQYQQEAARADEENKNLGLAIEKMRMDDKDAAKRSEQFQKQLEARDAQLWKQFEYQQALQEERLEAQAAIAKANNTTRKEVANANNTAKKGGTPNSKKFAFDVPFDFGDDQGPQNIPITDGEMRELYAKLMSVKKVQDENQQLAYGIRSASTNDVKNLVAKYSYLVEDELRAIHAKRSGYSSVPAAGGQAAGGQQGSGVYNAPAAGQDNPKKRGRSIRGAMGG